MKYIYIAIIFLFSSCSSYIYDDVYYNKPNSYHISTFYITFNPYVYYVPYSYSYYPYSMYLSYPIYYPINYAYYPYHNYSHENRNTINRPRTNNFGNGNIPRINPPRNQKSIKPYNSPNRKNITPNVYVRPNKYKKPIKYQNRQSQPDIKKDQSIHQPIKRTTPTYKRSTTPNRTTYQRTTKSQPQRSTRTYKQTTTTNHTTKSQPQRSSNTKGRR